jgi:quinone-reactive Ni/Fe-hydrogenase small subunit/[NiFe] hydrogenase small subunit
MAPLEKPLDEKSYGGGEKTVDNIGIALTGAAVAGVAIHAVATKIRHKRSDDRMNTKEEKHD